MPHITIGTTMIPYTCEERPRRQHADIQIDAQKQVTVLLPSDFDPDHVEPLLHPNAAWLLKHWTTAPSEALVSPKDFVSGEGFLLRGRLLRLKVQRTQEALSVRLEGRRLLVTVPAHDHGEATGPIREALMQWYAQQALELFSERLDHYGPIVGSIPERVKIAEYKTRWGFCRADGLVALNWRLVQAPLSVIDYVIVHELTHRLYPHHRRTFWQAVEVILPDFEVRKAWLRDHGAELGW